MTSKTTYLEAIWREGAFLLRDEEFTLKSGRKSHVYANHRHMISEPTMLRSLGQALADLAVERFGPEIFLCAVGSSTSPYLTASASLGAGLPLVNYRPVNREKGIPDSIFSIQGLATHTDDPKKPVVFVDDVVTTSRTIDTARQDLDYGGWEVRGAVCLLDRQSAEDAASAEVPIAGVASLRDVIEHGLAHGLIADELRHLAERELT